MMEGFRKIMNMKSSAAASTAEPVPAAIPAPIQPPVQQPDVIVAQDGQLLFNF